MALKLVVERILSPGVGVNHKGSLYVEPEKLDRLLKASAW